MRKLMPAIETAVCAACGAGILALTTGITAEAHFNGAILGALLGAGLLWLVRALATAVGQFRNRVPPDGP